MNLKNEDQKNKQTIQIYKHRLLRTPLGHKGIEREREKKRKKKQATLTEKFLQNTILINYYVVRKIFKISSKHDFNQLNFKIGQFRKDEKNFFRKKFPNFF